MPGRRVPQCKGKATTVPKPARGSGLNPSGLPIADQLYLPAEQPRMSMFDFNPYEPSTQGWSGYGDEQGPSFYGGGASFGGAQGTMSFGGAQGALSLRDTLGVLSLGDAQDQGPSLYDNAQDQGPSFSDNVPGPSSFGEQPVPFYDGLQGASSYNEGLNYFNDFREDASPSPGPSGHRQGLAPVSRWVKGAPDHGVSIVDRGGGLDPPASDLTMIRQGEVPAFEVVHTTGPARSTTRATRHANMPATPYQEPRTPAVTELHDASSDQPPSSSSASRVIKLTSDIIKQTIQSARVLVTWVVFSKAAMMYSSKQKRRIIDRIIKESVPQFYRPNDFAREGVTTAFRLFPPRGHTSPPNEFRITRVSALIQGADPLLFMHDFYFDENDAIIIRARFQNPFVMANAIHFVWYWGNTSFLDTASSKLKAIKHVSVIYHVPDHVR
ncbi:hypothetical protein BDR03DRAFT_1007710 [Suillus americanus]|nr:hypothetical protein BDR03DRAFT_1007710 [Suillus americanus]